MTVLMANCLGRLDGVECAGGSAIWNRNGVLLKRLDDFHEGVIGFDTETGEAMLQPE